MIASPAFRSTARSGNIAPRHLSQIVMDAVYHDGKWKHIHLKYWVFWGNRPSSACQGRPLEQRVEEEKLLISHPEQAEESLTGVMLSHRIVVLGRDPHYV